MGFAYLNRFDDSIVHWLNALVGRSVLFDKAMGFVCGDALLKGVLFICLFWYFWFRQSDAATRQRTREHLLCTIGGGLVAILLARILALTLPFRLRPRFENSLHFVLPQGAPTGNLWNWSAFPSDHAVMFSALAAGLFFISRRVGLLAYLYIILIVAFPRIYLGIHYTSDVLVGMTVGTILGICSNLPATRAALGARMLRFESTSPGAFYVGMFILSFMFSTMFDSLREGAQAASHVLAQLSGKY